MVDKYTKVVLTIIAFCLVVLTVRVMFDFPEAQASRGTDINIASIAGKEIHCGVMDKQLYVGGAPPVGRRLSW